MRCGKPGASVGVTSANTDGTSLFRLKKAAAGGPNESVDLSNGTNVQVATRKISKELGGVDAAIVAPNLYHAAPIRKTLDADIQRVLMGNLGGTYAAFRSATREFRGRPRTPDRGTGRDGSPGPDESQYLQRRPGWCDWVGADH